MASSPPLYRPIPRRPFNHSSVPQQPPSPLLGPSQTDDTPSRTRSVLNLTSSTLLGIYSGTGGGSWDQDEPSTPWGTGAESPQIHAKPIRRNLASRPAPNGPAAVLALVLRGMTLFGIGMLYGLLVKHLHNDRKLAAFPVEGIIKPTDSWGYLIFWGIAGVALGNLLPWVDTLWDENLDDDVVQPKRTKPIRTENELDASGIFGADWTPVIRSVGAFVGIAFAIRKLPWTSTLQASLTLALVNPVLWYIIDRSKPGFFLSVVVGFMGSVVLLVSSPDMMPSPAASSYAKNATHQQEMTNDLGGLGTYVSRESLEGGIWVLSVLFCSCVCFGNIGRALALNGGKTQPQR
ncbi:insulin-induced protein-domain-containing protein [Calycina marina]|uniref:Insulin-induced protein-domain-containing protein n=1 Tax=Calycina marina TaxID=1763456 RepID=A0A9P7YVT3_9HELO|nr:insulin-induced protein-domain-containing protein [Calycina marina]